MNFQKFLADKKHLLNFIPIILLVVIILWILHDTMSKSSENMEDVETTTIAPETTSMMSTPMTTLVPVTTASTVAPNELLPKEGDIGKFVADFPCGEGDIAAKNFLTAGYNMGINTISGSLKNANLQLRSDPVIPKGDVGPWNQSTFLADNTRKHFEIGA